jgi:hypothetical protein
MIDESEGRLTSPMSAMSAKRGMPRSVIPGKVAEGGNFSSRQRAGWLNLGHMENGR